MNSKLGPYLLGPNDENQGIYTGDARELARAIPDESVDLIFTDPVYDRIEDYRWLAETAARVLKPDSACLVWFPVEEMPAVIHLMTGVFDGGVLAYLWLLDFVLIGTPLFYGNIGVKSQKCLWVEKGRSSLSKMILDVTMINAYQRPNRNNAKVWKESSRGGAKLKGGMTDWGKDVTGTGRFVSAFTQQGGTVLDPFTGSGTVPAVCKMLGRRWLAFEIDPDVAERARERVQMTQPPLFVPEPEQIGMDLE
jgi:site-specific DNA-methyltransferase (adenine-specific)